MQKQDENLHWLAGRLKSFFSFPVCVQITTLFLKIPSFFSYVASYPTYTLPNISPLRDAAPASLGVDLPLRLSQRSPLFQTHLANQVLSNEGLPTLVIPVLFRVL